MTAFELDPRLARDCFEVTSLPLCKLLLMNDLQYPWFILVPQRADIREVFELSEADQTQLWAESRQLSQILMQQFNGDKLNIAALGNVVPQLHLHHVVRYAEDVAWPHPVWGRYAAKPYTQEQAERVIGQMRTALS
ncbi:HIT domain-containing protein [Aliidiomarina sp. Khilg15.8]